MGVSIDFLENSEESEISDWLDACGALHINDKLELMNIAQWGQSTNKKGRRSREKEFQQLQLKQSMLFADNPYLNKKISSREEIAKFGVKSGN